MVADLSLYKYDHLVGKELVTLVFVRVVTIFVMYYALLSFTPGVYVWISNSIVRTFHMVD